MDLLLEWENHNQQVGEPTAPPLPVSEMNQDEWMDYMFLRQWDEHMYDHRTATIPPSITAPSGQTCEGSEDPRVNTQPGTTRETSKLFAKIAAKWNRIPSLRQLRKQFKGPNTAEQHHIIRCKARAMSKEYLPVREQDCNLKERILLRISSSTPANPSVKSTSNLRQRASSVPSLALSNRFAILDPSSSTDSQDAQPQLSGAQSMPVLIDTEKSLSEELSVAPARVVKEIVIRRRRPDCLNKSAYAPENVDDEPGEDRPVFYPELQLHEPTMIEYDPIDRVVGERTLIAKLQCDAAFQKRDEHLLRQLKMKAQRYVAQYDTCNQRPEDITNLIIHSVAAAYQPSRAELIARRFLSNRKVEFRVKLMNEFLDSIRSGLLSTLFQAGTADLFGGRLATNFA